MRRLLLSLLCLSTLLHAAPLKIYWIDSEGGGSTLITTPAGESILIDTGNPGGRDSKRIHEVATKQAGLTRLDHVIITHFHVDHFGGLAELATMLPIGTIYDKGVPEGSPDGKPQDMRWTLMKRPYLDARAEKRVTLTAGQTIPLKTGEGAPLTLTCLGANQQFIAPKPDQAKNPLTGTVPTKAPDPSDNANSTVFVLDLGGFRFFNGGDLTWNVEDKLVCPYNLPGEVDLYQVNHHGLDVSNNPVLIRSLSPTVAVFNNGPKKGTSGVAMDALKSTPTVQAIYQVHENIREDRENNTQPERIANHGDKGEACEAGIVICEVAPDGASYTLAVPSQKHREMFETRKKSVAGER